MKSRSVSYFVYIVGKKREDEESAIQPTCYFRRYPFIHKEKKHLVSTSEAY